MPGQPDIRPAHLFGIDCDQLLVLDPNGEESNLIIETTRTFQVQTRFQFGGPFALWLVQLPMTYTVTYYYDCIGRADEGTLATVTGNTIAGQLVYDVETNQTVSLPNPGTYRLTAVVTFGAAPMTAFMEGPIIQIF